MSFSMRCVKIKAEHREDKKRLAYGGLFVKDQIVTGGIARWIGSGSSVLRRCLSGLWRLEAQIKGVQFEGRVMFAGRPMISVAGNSTFIVGRDVEVASALRANPLGCFQPCVLRTLAPGARLVLGDNAGLSATVLCAGLSIEIGGGTLIGAGTMIIDNDFHVYSAQGWRSEMQAGARPVKIGREVFIGARAIILKGVTIGDRAVIGAGAVVTRDVPADHLAAGNPAAISPKRR
jgi:acetyltransferase-like isoleucine patch superfamily enzyme